MAAPEAPRCGNCKFFDLQGVDGSPFPTKSGREGGVCRVNSGLRFGILAPESPCRQPVGVFERKTQAATQTPGPKPA